MRRSTPRQLIALLLTLCLLPLAGVTLAACGGDENAGSGDAAAQAENGEQASKVEIALRLGLAYGAYKRWIQDPAQEGQFQSGVDGRKRAIAKAALAGAFVARMLQKANEEAKKDPRYTDLVAKITASAATLGGLTSILKGGEGLDVSQLTGGNDTFDSLLDLAGKEGVDVKPQDVSATDLLKGF